MNILLNFRFLLFLGLLGTLFLVSCQSDTSLPSGGSVNKKVLPKSSVELFGEVVSVDLTEKFVLIKTRGKSAGGESLSLYVKEGERYAVLNPTGESIQNVLAADIMSGEVLVGDQVYMRPKNSLFNVPSSEVEKTPGEAVEDVVPAGDTDEAVPEFDVDAPVQGEVI